MLSRLSDAECGALSLGCTGVIAAASLGAQFQGIQALVLVPTASVEAVAPRTGAQVLYAVHMLSGSTACGILLARDRNLSLLDWQAILTTEPRGRLTKVQTSKLVT